MSDPDNNTLEYATPASIEGVQNQLARDAFRCAVWGFLIPFVGFIAVLLGVAALARRVVMPADRTLALKGIFLGVFSFSVNLLLVCLLILPSLGRARPGANAIKCSSNMRQIWLAMAMYANENKDAIGSDPFKLLISQDITRDVFICPNSIDYIAQLPNPVTKIAEAVSVCEGTATCSYFFCRFPDKKFSELNPRQVLIIEKNSNHTESEKNSMNFLTADGSSHGFDQPKASQILSELASGQNPPSSIP